MFKNRRFAIGVFSAVLAYIGLCVIIYQLPLFTQVILGLSQLETGLIILGTPIAMATTAVISGYLADRIDAKYITTLGIGVMTLSLIFGAVFTTDVVAKWVLAIIAVIIGIALGSFIAPNNTSVMSAAPENKLGVANSMISLSTNVGFSIGTALATAVFIYSQNYFQKKNGGLLDDASNYVPAMKVLFVVFAVFMFCSTIFSWFRGPDPFERSFRKNKKD